MSKAASIREYAKKHPDASPQNVADALGEQGIDVEAKYVRRVKKRAKQGIGNRGSGPRPFPANTLEEAVAVPKAVKDFNGGNPWPPKEVANAIGVGKTTHKFYYLTASSRDYGFTEGTRDSDEVELVTLGRELVYTPSPEAEFGALKKAFFNRQYTE